VSQPEPEGSAGGRTRAPRRRDGARPKRRLGDFGLFATLQPVAAALHGGGELLEVDLERVEDVVGVVLGAEPDLALARSRVLDDLLRLALGLPFD